MKKTFFYLLIILFSMTCSAVEVTVDEKIEFEKLISYNAPSTMRYAQGMDIYDGRVFQAFSDGTIDVYNLTNGQFIQKIGPLQNERGIALHMNDLTFISRDGKSFLITSGNSINSMIHLFEVKNNESNYELEKSDLIPPPMIDATINKESSQYFGNENYFIQVGYLFSDNNGYGDSIIEGYTFDSLSHDICYTQQWSLVYNKLWAMQGAYINGKVCYMAVGVPHGDAKIYKIDIYSGLLSCYLDFRKYEDMIPNEEMQGLAIYQGYMYFSTTYGLYKLKLNQI